MTRFSNRIGRVCLPAVVGCCVWIGMTAPLRGDPAAPAPAAAKKSPAKVVIDFNGIRDRIRAVPVGLDASSLKISPDGKTLLFTAAVASQQNLYTYSLDELAREAPVARQLTSTPGGKSNAQWSPDGREIFYLESGRIQTIAVDTRVARPVAATAELDIDFSKEKMQTFAEAWRMLNDNFYDPEFHGVNWPAMRKTFEPQIAGARTPDEMRRIISLMLGELNASHLGISAGFGQGGPEGGAASGTGKLGLRFDRAEYEMNGRFKVTEVIRLSPADVAGVKAGAYLIALDGITLNSRTNLDELLDHKVDRRVVLTIGDGPNGEGKREIPLRPVSTATEKNLLYRDWVENRRDYVHKASNGRLGYVHMPDMGAESLQKLYLDLDTENVARDGVIIDIRSNNGGFVNV